MQSLVRIWNLISIICICSTLAYWPGKLDTEKSNDSCFCQLSGQVDDCCCTINDVEKLNNLYINPRLNNLAARNYFRYIKLKLFRVCPFWNDHFQCAIKDCSVDKCSEDELPAGLKQFSNGHQEKNENKYKKELNTDNDEETDDGPCSVGHDDSLSDIDTTISDRQKQSFKVWNDYDADTSFCVDLEEDSEDADWVDLLLNPERFTGYEGKSAHLIWSSIYQENCFLPTKKMTTYDDFKNSFLSSTCLEKRVFYRTVSGLHASINIHLSYHYLLSKGSFTNKKVWGPNLDEFHKRFDAESTNENGPHWLKNLYFTYLLTLRAVTKAYPYWKEVTFFTGEVKEDQEIKKVILELVQTSKTCPSTFDESQMFTGDPVKANALKEEFRLHYMNITRIMDCVGCEKCRLWGKLQTNGIGTALKILFASDKWEEIPVINGKKFLLSRTEIVSLFNALNKLSNSITYIKKFKILNDKRRK